MGGGVLVKCRPIMSHQNSFWNCTGGMNTVLSKSYSLRWCLQNLSLIFNAVKN